MPEQVVSTVEPFLSTIPEQLSAVDTSLPLLPQINSSSSFHHERVKPQNGYTAKHESKQTIIRVTKPSKWGCACNLAVIERVRL
ncbi:hypothetical protein DAI22_01g435801 [Oryza sativa Japonica Group]|nr:hypothetical protein DAI22_01g435801 [Oryza sativa Japonica Group]